MNKEHQIFVNNFLLYAIILKCNVYKIEYEEYKYKHNYSSYYHSVKIRTKFDARNVCDANRREELLKKFIIGDNKLATWEPPYYIELYLKASDE
jgi:hypothetical protein